MSDVWTRAAHFLSALNRENINREDYIKTPESERAEKMLAEKEEPWEEWLDGLSKEDRAIAEDMKECLEEYSSAHELRSYVQGYVDCMQILSTIGLLRKSDVEVKIPMIQK